MIFIILNKLEEINIKMLPHSYIRNSNQAVAGMKALNFVTQYLQVHPDENPAIDNADIPNIQSDKVDEDQMELSDIDKQLFGPFIDAQDQLESFRVCIDILRLATSQKLEELNKKISFVLSQIIAQMKTDDLEEIRV